MNAIHSGIEGMKVWKDKVLMAGLKDISYNREYSGNDLKEGYHVGKERSPDGPMLQWRFNGSNKWPPRISEFVPVMSRYYDTMYEVAFQIMEFIAL